MIHAKKIIINQDWHLCIQRHHDTNVHPIVCPYRPGHHYCGNWCPHFGDIERTLPEQNGKEYVLTLTCGFGARVSAPEVSPEPPVDYFTEFYRCLMRVPPPIVLTEEEIKEHKGLGGIFNQEKDFEP